MKPFYWRGTTNFGDYLNSWIWPRLLDGYLDENDGVRLVGIGSLLKGTLNNVEGKKVIFGTGSGYGSIPDPKAYQDWSFYFVRGPMTAKAFNLGPEKSLVDGAWLLSQIPEYSTPVTAKKSVSFVPHWTTSDTGDWGTVCKKAGLNFVDPLDDLSTVLSTIANSELVIAESLHGAIMADYFRTPWIPVSISPKFLPFKWVDWFQSLELEPTMTPLPLSDWFEYVYSGKSRKGISYELREVPISADVGVVETKSADKPGAMYAKKIKLKRHLREMRRKTLAGLSTVRNVYPISRWNAAHQDKLANMLREVAKGKPSLSKEAVHAEKIERLSAITETLKNDYDSGKLKP